MNNLCHNINPWQISSVFQYEIVYFTFLKKSSFLFFPRSTWQKVYSSTQWTALSKSISHNGTAPQEHSDFCKNMQAIQHRQYRWQRINPESLFQVDHFKPSPHVASSQRVQANRHPSILSCAFWSRGSPLRPFLCLSFLLTYFSLIDFLYSFLPVVLLLSESPPRAFYGFGGNGSYLTNIWYKFWVTLDICKQVESWITHDCERTRSWMLWKLGSVHGCNHIGL